MGLFKRIIVDKQEQPVTTKQKIATRLSQRDPIEKLNLMEHSFNALTHAGVQIVGQLLKLVESGEIRAIHGLRSTSILEIEVKLAQLEIADNSEVEANSNATPDQNDVPLSREVPVEKSSLIQPPPTQLHTDNQAVGEIEEQVKSSESPIISEGDANLDTMPDQNDAFLLQEDAPEEPSSPQHSPNPLIHTESQTVGEVTQHVESTEIQTTSEAEANIDTTPDQSAVSLSQEDSIERLSLTRHTLNLLKHTDIQTVGDLLQWFESGRLQTIPALGRISILEIEDELARMNPLDDIKGEANSGVTPDQNDVSFSQEDVAEETSLPQHSPNPPIHTESQTVEEDTHHVESAEIQTIVETEVNVDAIPDQNDISLSQEDAAEEPSLTEHSPNPSIHTESQTVREGTQHIESSELQTISEAEADTNETSDQKDVSLSQEDSTKKITLNRDALNRLKQTDVRTVGQLLQWVQSGKSQTIAEAEADTNETSDQKDVPLSREDSTEEPSLTEHSPNPLIDTDSQTIGEDTQQIESSEYHTTSEIEANTDATLSQDDVSLSREDSIEKLNLTEYSFNALTALGVQTVGEVLNLVESGKHRPISTLGRKFILEIERKLAQVKLLDDSETEANTDATLSKDDVSSSRKDLIEEPNLTQHSPNPPIHTESQTVGEVGQQVESTESPITSEAEANTNATPSRNDIYLSRGDTIEKLSLSQRTLNVLKNADIWMVGELLQLVELGRLRAIRGLGRKSISEIEKRLAQVRIHDNYAYLSKEDSIGQLNLRNRSFNAFTRIGIQTIGQVLKLVESGQLQTIPALGRKSILEIKTKLAQVKILNDSEVGANTDAIPDRNDGHLSLEDPIDWLYLTPRSFNMLMHANIQTIGELLQLVESNGLRIIRGLEQKSILEIKEKLIQAKFLNDSEIEANTDTIPWVVVRWQSELVMKQLSKGLLHEEAIIAETSIKDWLAGIETAESNRVYKVLATILSSSLNICEEVEFFLNQIPGQYLMTVLLAEHGLEPKNLRETGDEIGISRERVRQIRRGIKDKATSIINLKTRPDLLRMQSALFIARDLGLDITYEQWTQRIRSSGLIGNWTSQDYAGTDAVEAMIAICNLLTDCKIPCLQMPKNLQYAVQFAAEGKPNVPAKMLHAVDTLPDQAKRLIDRHTKFSGGVYARWLSQEMEIELEEVTNILQGLGYKALSKGWFTSHQISYSDVFHRCLRQMFQYCGRLGIEDICAGIRYGISRSGSSVPAYLAGKDTDGSVFPVPPPDVMAEILRTGSYQSEDELYYWEGTYDEKLSKGEIIIMNCLEQIGPVLHHSELVHAFIERELSLPALSATLNSSPLFDKVESGLYKLRGKEVTHQDIERAKAAGKPQSLRPEIEYDTDGNIIVRVTLSAIAVGSGTILCERFPDLSGADWECYVGSERAGELNAVENEFRRLKKPFELLNCQPGERVKFTFNTWERRVTIEKEEGNAEN